ncbi:hypothetical protein GIB67_030111 [Kingdonia uniflora]|uniref:RRM domain-containing protein n=1 Tax=Kingdonia uniflora TaxID=39325 RepID=A0A7J7L2G0_9MAGN|nr:hypothetical protein GIB67_030111 [Kingdonia uniflora]
MDFTNPNKRIKIEENGTTNITTDCSPIPTLTPEDFRKFIEPFTQDQLLQIIQSAALRHHDVLESIRAIANRDPAQRKLFIRGLGWDTTSDSLRALFASYGDLEEAIVILDKATGKSKGYGFVIFKNVDGAMMALKEPSKKIDGRMTVTQLASAGITTGPTASVPTGDAAFRKVFVGNVPVDMPADRLLVHFSSYGEIEEGPLGYDKVTEKSRGYAMFVYKTVEGAQASLVDPMKSIDGHSFVCRLANDSSKKGKLVNGVGKVQTLTAATPVANVGEPVGVPPQSLGPGSLGAQAPGYGAGPSGLGAPAGLGTPSGLGAPPPYGAPGSFGMPGHLGGLSAVQQGQPGMAHHHLNSSMQSTFGATGLSSVPSSLGTGAGYASGLGGPYSGLGPVPTSAGYGAAGYGAFSGMGSSLYRLPPGSTGLPSGGYPEGGHYGGLSSSTFSGHLHQPLRASTGTPVPLPPGRMYPNLPPYY